MPRTIAPEEQKRVQNVSELQTIKPTPKRTVFIDSDNEGAPNVFIWNAGGDASLADGSEFVASTFSGFGDGEANEGVWQRLNLPFAGAARTDDLAEGSNEYYTETRARNEFSVSGDLTYSSTTGELGLDVSSLSASDLLGNKDTDDLPEGTTNDYYTDERAQDGVGNIIEGGGRTTASYDDAAPSVTLETTDEAIQDAVYENVLSGTQTLVTVNYDDASNEVGFEVSGDLAQFDLSNVTTDDLSEGTENLYYTSERTKDEFQVGGDLNYTKNIGTGTATVSLDVSTLSATDLFGQKRTDDLPEGGSSLYFTGERTREAINAALNGIGVNITYEESSQQNFGDPLIEISGVDTGPDVSDDGTQVTQNTPDLNFGTGIGALNDNGIADIPLFDQFGSATFDGDGSSTQYSVQHGLTSAPESVQVQPTTDDASSISHIDYDDTVITIFYDTPPPAGTDNLKIYYKLKVDLNQAPFWDNQGDLVFSFDQ